MDSSWLASFVLIVGLIVVFSLAAGVVWLLFFLLSHWDQRLD